MTFNGVNKPRADRGVFRTSVLSLGVVRISIGRLGVDRTSAVEKIPCCLGVIAG